MRVRRPTVFVEVLPESPKLRALLVELCRDVGYRCYAATPDRLISLPADRIPTVVVQREFGSNDLILTTDSEIASVSP